MECQNIVTNLPGYGVILILPNAKLKYQEVLTDLFNEAGLHITQTEKVFDLTFAHHITITISYSQIYNIGT